MRGQQSEGEPIVDSNLYCISSYQYWNFQLSYMQRQLLCLLLLRNQPEAAPHTDIPKRERERKWERERERKRERESERQNERRYYIYIERKRERERERKWEREWKKILYIGSGDNNILSYMREINFRRIGVE